MHLESTVRAGLSQFAVALGVTLSALALTIPSPVAAAPVKAPAHGKPAHLATATKAAAARAGKAGKSAKPGAKSTGKATSKPARTAVGSTATKTVENLIKAMQARDEELIGSAFNWDRFTQEMNNLLPDKKGLDKATYKQLLVATLNVEPAVSNNLRVGQESRKSPTTATVEMRRVFPAGTGGSTSSQIKTINILSLAKEKDGWRIFKLDTAQTHTVPTATPAVPRAPQGMVPAAGSEKH